CLARAVDPPRSLRARVRDRLSQLAGGTLAAGPLGRRGVDLLFSVMTDPVLAEPDIPTVSILYDLQHLAFPDFFSAAERDHRDAFFERVRTGADVIVSISEFTRREIVSRLRIDPRRVRTIPIAIQSRLDLATAGDIARVRTLYGLDDAPF